jgi:hypothetical protein
MRMGVWGLAPIRIKLRHSGIEKAEIPSELLFAKTTQFWKKELPHGHGNEGLQRIKEHLFGES